MSAPAPDSFFIGFLGTLPPALRGFVARVVAVVLVAAGGLGLAISASEPDPGGGAFRFDLGVQSLVGVVRADPYGTLTLTEPAGTLPVGHTVMLAGPGKTGVRDQTAPLDGRVVRLGGFLLARGDLDMLQLEGRIEPVDAAGLAATDPAGAAPSADIDLGRWRITGEICDGKCLAGAMRPGLGLAHKACANLCVVGDIPPVFATTAPVAGTRFLLIAGPDGGPMPSALLDDVGLLVELTGRVLRRGDLTILQVEPGPVRRW